jgi:hypothetical protein
MIEGKIVFGGGVGFLDGFYREDPQSGS